MPTRPPEIHRLYELSGQVDTGLQVWAASVGVASATRRALQLLVDHLGNDRPVPLYDQMNLRAVNRSAHANAWEGLGPA